MKMKIVARRNRIRNWKKNPITENEKSRWNKRADENGSSIPIILQDQRLDFFPPLSKGKKNIKNYQVASFKSHSVTSFFFFLFLLNKRKKNEKKRLTRCSQINDFVDCVQLFDDDGLIPCNTKHRVDAKQKVRGSEGSETILREGERNRGKEVRKAGRQNGKKGARLKRRKRSR